MGYNISVYICNVNISIIYFYGFVNRFPYGLNIWGRFVMSEKGSSRKTEALRLSNEELKRLTRESIQDALIILMGKKEYSEISVTEIVQKAGVSRTAYYRNYSSKDDVLEHFLNEAISVIYDAMKEFNYDTDEYGFWLTMFKNILPYADTLRLLFRRGFGEKIENGMLTLMLAEYDELTEKDKYVECFWCGAVCSVIRQWVADDMLLPPESMAEICCKIEGK